MADDNSRLVKVRVKVTDLKEGMVIKAYSRFSSHYDTMDERTCLFLRYNFRGSRIIVNRGNRKLNIRIEEVQPGDSLKGIFNFPTSLRKITVVTKHLPEELRRRGMLEFITVQPKPEKNKTDPGIEQLVQLVEQVVNGDKETGCNHRNGARAGAVRIATELLEAVEKNLPLRQKTRHSIQHDMENARKGKLSVKAIRDSVRQIVSDDSIESLVAISSMKESVQTDDHCLDVGVIFQSVYLKIQRKRKKASVFKNPNQALLGGFLHDFGKSLIPESILDSQTEYAKNSRAMQIIRSHPVFGAQQLSTLNMPKPIVDMAHYHHVKMNPAMLSSYPQSVKADDIGFESRLIAIIDIYQALVGTRKYKKSWSPPATMRYLEALAGVEIDQFAFDLFITEMGLYPKGSLVELSDSSIGFVMNVPRGDRDLSRPIITVVRDGNGEDMTHHDLVDLSVERDIRITRDLDRRDVFGEQTLERFTHINIAS